MKYIIPFLYWVGTILIGTILSSIFYYFNITSDKFNSILLYLISIVGIFIGSYKFSKTLNKKGIISGLIFFIINSIIMLMLSLIIFKTNIKINNIINYIILLIFSLLAGIIGKNKKEEAKV